jgi:hypothetical protein
MRDTVDYELPMGFLGKWPKLFVKETSISLITVSD